MGNLRDKGKKKLRLVPALQRNLTGSIPSTCPGQTHTFPFSQEGRAELLPDVRVLGDEAQHLQAEQCWVFEADQLLQGKDGLQALLTLVQTLGGRAATCWDHEATAVAGEMQSSPHCPHGDLRLAPPHSACPTVQPQ